MDIERRLVEAMVTLCKQGGDIAKAESIVKEVRESTTDLKPKNKIQSYIIEGCICSAREQFPEALDKFKEALELTYSAGEEIEDREITIRNNRANTLYAMGRYEEAIEDLQIAINLSEKTGDQSLEPIRRKLERLMDDYKVKR